MIRFALPVCLAFSLVSCAATAPSLVSSAPVTYTLEVPSSTLTHQPELVVGISNLDKTNSTSIQGQILAVRNALTSVVAGIPDPTQAHVTIGAALEEMYPGLVTGSAELIGYRWVWNPETGEWEYVCNADSSYQIKRGGMVVLVEISVNVLLSED